MDDLALDVRPFALSLGFGILPWGTRNATEDKLCGSL